MASVTPIIIKIIPLEEVESVAAAIEIIDEDYKIESYPSTPATLINIPEVKSFTGNFVYNFYLADERTNSNQLGVINYSNSTQKDKQLAKLNKMPRYNRCLPNY